MSDPWIICPVCSGNGAHVNPNIDAHGISREEFDEDPDFREDYMSGVYNITCATCSGSGKLKQSEWTEKQGLLTQAAEDRKLRMQEDGIFESGVSDWRFGY